MDDAGGNEEESAPIPSGRGATLSVKEAQPFTRQWIDYRMGPARRGYIDQMRMVMNQLAAAALGETIKTAGDGYDYQDRLGDAYEILNDLWMTLTTDELKGWNDRGDELTEEQIKARQSAKLTLWRRRDPLQGYREGFESEYQTNFDREMFDDTAARYLARPWMKTAHLDWVFVDASITRELSAFGEEVKRQFMAGRRDMLGASHHRYFATKGNLAEMSKPDWGGRLQYLFWYVAFVFAIPIGCILAAFYNDWTTTGLWLSGIYGVLLLIEFSTMAFNLARRGIRAARGLQTPGTKAQELFAAMYQVWRLLKGPVVNPSLVRAEMTKTAEAGAGWDTVAYSIVDRVIARDAAVWVISMER
ncbi:hypothetical protein [Bosea sp. LjRoot237]|uniref:hypothetical protein n=1 Tax=Bosea sp. LjRoot237 TaxID=3342292 RepID=UPI003ECE5ADC